MWTVQTGQTVHTGQIGQTRLTGQTGKTLFTLKFDFPGHVCRAAFTILEFIIYGP